MNIFGYNGFFYQACWVTICSLGVIVLIAFWGSVAYAIYHGGKKLLSRRKRATNSAMVPCEDYEGKGGGCCWSTSSRFQCGAVPCTIPAQHQ
jgi:hypothetical protein